MGLNGRWTSDMGLPQAPTHLAHCNLTELPGLEGSCMQVQQVAEKASCHRPSCA